MKQINTRKVAKMLLCYAVTSNDIKKIKTTIDNMFLEKQKLEKGDKAKSKGKGKGKAKLKLEDENVSRRFTTRKPFS